VPVRGARKRPEGLPLPRLPDAFDVSVAIDLGPPNSSTWKPAVKTTIRHLLAPLVLVCLGLGAPLSAQVAQLTARDAIDSLLVASRLLPVLDGLGRVMVDQVERGAPELAPDVSRRVEVAIARHFAPHLLLESVATLLATAADTPALDELVRGLGTGPAAEARRLADAHRPLVSLPEYAATLTDAPPPQERIQLMLRLARAQGAGPFYLSLAETLRGAAHLTVRAVRPGTPPFRGMPGEEVPLLMEAHAQQAVLGLLYRFETVPDTLVESLAERWETDLGQWFVDAIADAVSEALLAAAERVTAELK